MPDLPIDTALRANMAVIRQGISLLADLGPDRFATRIPLCYRGSIGGHLRHVFEHYQSFLQGLDSGGIDYENRPRDSLIESRLDYAAEVFEGIHDRLQGLFGTLSNRDLAVVVETSPGSVAGSSVLRELEFLISHTIHHYALVAVMARLQGFEPEASFGIAPSTLKYQEAQAACAR